MTRPLVARKGLVYFIEAIGPSRVKIGFTSGDPEYRARRLQTACPFPLRVLGAFPGTTVDEADLHERFAALRAVEGTEWFRLTEAMSEWVAQRVGERVGADSATANREAVTQ